MKCPFCSEPNTQVIDTRENEEGDTVRRRRRCLACDKRFTTYERVELNLPQVVKKNGSRTDYDRDKLKASMMTWRWTASRKSWCNWRCARWPRTASVNW